MSGKPTPERLAQQIRDYDELCIRSPKLDRERVLGRIVAQNTSVILDALTAAQQQGQAVDAVLAAVREEIERATAKFPTWPTDPLHASGVVQEEAGELAKAVLQAVYEPHKSAPEDVASEAFQTAAMAVRFLVSMGRYDWTPGVQHRQE